MHVIHTADWHLGDRLGRIDRTDDLRRAIERIAAYCRQHEVDVLLVAGDLFSELARPDNLRDAIEHMQEIFREFLTDGGTILTLTGNHDNETFCQTLNHAMSLAAPIPAEPGTVAPAGRLYLATEPKLLRLRDRKVGFDVQFVLMPYPTPTRYLSSETGARYSSPEEKNRVLEIAFTGALRGLQAHPRFDPALPAVLAAHINMRGALIGSGLFRISEIEDVVLDPAGLVDPYCYVALGHIHRPQLINGQKHIRYSGSVERMDLGEKGDTKSVVLFEVGAGGLSGDPQLLPMESTPICEIDVRDPAEDIPRLRAQYADAKDDLVNIHLVYTAGKDNLEDVLRQLDGIFPRWYSRDWRESGSLGPSLVGGEGEPAAKGFAETVWQYVDQELLDYQSEERLAIFERLELLLREGES